uniref:Mcl1_mid domain-containing protein n=1 Tax=Heterorhabditis bacteriophora TaxID=37862 RepID=A0A1I7XL31_HETBA
MSGNFSDIRNLHVKGLITLCCQNSETSQKFLSSGTDGTVYIWDEKCLTEGNPPQIKTIGDTTHSSLAWIDKDVYIGYTSTDLLTGVDKRMVGKCSIDHMESCSQIFSFSLEVTSIDASPTFLVAGGSDFTIKKINLKYRNEYDRIDASGEVLCVKIDPKDEVFAVTCCDGSLSLFHLQNNTRIVYLEKLFPSFAGIDADNPRHQITWSKDGQSLFVPVQGEVKILIRDGWKLSPNSFKGSGTELECFSVTCISSCGHFLAASTSNKICIWNILDSNSNVVFKEGLCMLENAVPIRSIETATNHISAENVLNSDEDDEDEADNIIKNHRRIIDDDAEDDTMSADIGLIKRKYGFGEDNSNALEEFGFLPETNSNPGFASDPSLKSDLKYSSVTETAVISSYKPPTIPERFVSGASPINLSQRYLKWNNYGVVRSFSGDNASSIEHYKGVMAVIVIFYTALIGFRNFYVLLVSFFQIEFHDSTIHPEIILDNGETDYCMADLSDCAVALANIPEAKGEQR